MGAPVVTMPRNTFASRHLTSHLMALGAPEFIATDESTYVKLAVNLASDPDALA
jgi:predicted O-linked N-acetylglucosamine transferase (SPINDLY family)